MEWHHPTRNPDATRPTPRGWHTEYRLKAFLPTEAKTWRTQNFDSIWAKAEEAAIRYPDATLIIESRITSDWTYLQTFTDSVG